MKYKPLQILDITDWDHQIMEGTLGSRAKFVVQGPYEKRHFFKESHNRYPWEFWCEIIASKLGQLLKLDIVDYNVAIWNQDDTNQIVGCISEFMNDEEKFEILLHGQSLLKRIKPGFDTKKGTDHDFQLIEKSLSSFKDEKFIQSIITTIIFDALIGNRDRHQENWALLITVSENAITKKNGKISQIKTFFTLLQWIINFIKQKELNPSPIIFRPAPIFDNGSSLGHEIIEKNLSLYFTGDGSQDKLNKYIFGSKSQSHIRWEGEKLNHFELIVKVREKYKMLTLKAIEQIANNYNEIDVANLITNISFGFQPKNEKFVLSDECKQFLIKLVDLRAQKLIQLYNNWK